MHRRDRRGRAPSLIILGAGAVAALAWLRWRPFPIEVEGSSMAPTLRAGDWLFALGRARPRTGSLVVVEHPDRPGYEMVKRVAGMPGERVGARNLAADEYWVLGDDPAHSTDSRHFGPVRLDRIRGVARFRYRPRARRCFDEALQREGRRGLRRAGSSLPP